MHELWASLRQQGIDLAQVTPIDLAIHLPVGEIEVVAGDRTDTVVTVSPTNPAKAVDRRGAGLTVGGQRIRRPNAEKTSSAAKSPV